MKKLLGIVVLGLFWCNVGLTKDLTGKNLLCDGYTKNTKIGIVFHTSTAGTFYEIKNEPFWLLAEQDFRYIVTTDYIKMIADGKTFPSLNRKTLELGWLMGGIVQCELEDLKPGELDLLMQSLLNDLKKESEEKNKI